MTSGVLTFGKFPVDIFCWVEQVDEIEALTVFDVVAVGEELDVSYDGVIILSWSVEFNPGEHCLSSNWIESRITDTGIWFLQRWR